MAESRVHEHPNNVWPSPMGDGRAAMVDHYAGATVPNGLDMTGIAKEEQSPDNHYGQPTIANEFRMAGIAKEEEEPLFEDPNVADQFDMVDRVKSEEMEDIVEEDPVDNDFVAQYGMGDPSGKMVSSLITSTTPLDLATLLQSAASGDTVGMGEMRSSSLTPTGRTRKWREGNDEVKRKASNREAANRYREKKKHEMEVLRIEEEALRARNDELRQMETKLNEEIRRMRETMTMAFGFAPPYEHEPSIFEATPPCLIMSNMHDKSPKRIPFPKGLSPAEQNRESVRRDREKKKVRFEALKAEEAILAMGKQMLSQQVFHLEGEIRLMKERMREIGLAVPDMY